MSPSQTGLLAGKKALIMGVADKHSIAWGIAQAMHGQGASLAFTYQEEPKGRLERNVRKLVATLGNPEDFLLYPCDVTDDSTSTSVASYQAPPRSEPDSYCCMAPTCAASTCVPLST